MLSNKSMILPVAALGILPGLVAVCSQPAFCQTYKNWENNQINQIRQEGAAGMLNSNQQQFLLNRENQIQAQQQAFMNSNGGRLSPGETQQISRELTNVQREMGRGAYMNSGAGYGNVMYGAGAYPGMAGYGSRMVTYGPGMLGYGSGMVGTYGPGMAAGGYGMYGPGTVVTGNYGNVGMNPTIQYRPGAQIPGQCGSSGWGYRHHWGNNGWH